MFMMIFYFISFTQLLKVETTDLKFNRIAL